MEQIEFLELPQALKLVELLSKGTFLDFIIKGVYIVKLFQMKNYYIETYYHIEKNRFDSIITFDDTDKLTPYLKKIKLDIYPPPPPPPEKNIHSKGFEHIL
jgi:hypothetical protein